MGKKILINACYPEEKRVAIVENDNLIDFSVEMTSREYLKGNIYKGIVVRIEPGIQAAFVNFGPKKHGFLQMREVKPEFFKKRSRGKKAKIQDALEKGQELVVQVEKDERDTKGASLTTYVSLPGRYIVMIPGRELVGISRKIESREDRGRLKEMFHGLKLPKGTGYILRTASGDTTEKELSLDLKYLTRLWAKIQRDAKRLPAPSLIYREQDIAVRTARDYLLADVSEVIVDDAGVYRSIREFLRRTTPWQKINVSYYQGSAPLFAVHGIEEKISRITDRFVKLPSRGYLVFDKTEALTAIDVNSGRSRREKDEEATAFKTNMEAAEEIARQLRLRDLGGLIVIDFIDVSSQNNKREIEKTLKAALSSDKANTEIGPMSRFGLIEMTRERLRPPYLEAINRKCTGCGGTGLVRSDDVVAIGALRDIHGRVVEGGLQQVLCRLPMESANYLVNNKREVITSLERETGTKIVIVADAAVPAGTYEITVQKKAAEPPEAPKPT